MKRLCRKVSFAGYERLFGSTLFTLVVFQFHRVDEDVSGAFTIVWLLPFQRWTGLNGWPKSSELPCSGPRP